MKKVLLYFSCLFLVFSCKAESKNNIEEKKGVISNNSVISSSIQQQEDETWYFYGVSQLPIIGEESASREEINKKFTGYEISFLNSMISITGICSNKSYYIRHEKALSYWHSKNNMKYIEIVLSEDNIKIPDEITVILTGSPYDKCFSPFDELIQVGDYLITGYKDYLIYFKSKKSNVNNKQSNNINLPISSKSIQSDLYKINSNSNFLEDYTCGENYVKGCYIGIKNGYKIYIIENYCGDFPFLDLLIVKENMLLTRSALLD